MGCGGSRTDALEPRYMESWTKETESTWLTSTDTDVALSSIQNIPSENSSESGFASEKNLNSVSDFFDEGLPAPAQAYLKVCPAISEAGRNEVKTGSNNTSQDQVVAPSPGTTLQKRVLCTEEITKWQDNRMSSKQVTITVTKSIRQVDKSGKIKETSHTTFEVMKPADGPTETVAGKGMK
ncbi:brain and acute leukemia cytoplasmic protein [Brienomyrus brachyistius]|uniref:brain and acute leukemia cytoplasmic protein n=1 Tax=Brienomyrus brachyistius TaxID=42636 RepID=UPI0020B30792|nr:brain and acute leukemia cytoplasmic protein [Brienomyrus brachyistius]XP_048841927.1 brain and acute leukemia cytoplasmic protein [Brienomyrus brachyistius]XP_048841928.1 brain and acute leukemia cytoplasmic protein [Brienomyrus brachyistius]XP_048841929.1 brain and acute leukemia cytoplasmic protein [Brienomyrus brachyistius]XP_048841930.1 brain and acute leukemia cytoplasmic protein [Brienomyrus brachyistius]